MVAIRLLAALSLLLSGWVATAQAENGVRWETDLITAQKLAAQSNRLVLVHFGAPSCGPCQRLEREVFARPGFGQGLVQDFVLMKVNTDEDSVLAQQFGIQRIPADVVLTPDGRVVQKFGNPQRPEYYETQFAQIVAQYRGSLAAAGNRGAAPSETAAPPRAPSAAVQAPASDDRYADYFASRNPSMAAPVGAAPAAVPPANPYSPAPAMAGGVLPPASPPQPPIAPSANNLVGARYADAFAPPGSVPATSAPVGTSPSDVPGAAPSATVSPANQVAGGAGMSLFGTGAMSAPSESNKPATSSATNNVATGSATNQSASAAGTPQLPPGCPPLGLDGFCPVTLVINKRWAPGDVRWGAIHRGRTYLFASQAEQQMFLANPDRFSPMISGNDPVLALDRGQEVQGKPEHGVFLDGRIILFANKDTLETFSRNQHRYAAEIIQAMR